LREKLPTPGQTFFFLKQLLGMPQLTVLSGRYFRP
jgi:hypothetical protein